MLYAGTVERRAKMETIEAIIGTIGGLLGACIILIPLNATEWPDWLFLPVFLILWLVCTVGLLVLWYSRK